MIEFSPLRFLSATLKNHPKVALTDRTLTASAVLMPVFLHEGELGTLFIRRTHDVERHKGEYCFPGGFAEPADATPMETALRESQEELGIEPADVSILGELDDVRTLGQVKITPFVGQIPFPYAFRPNSAEVAEVVPLPLTALLAPDVRTIEVWQRPHPQMPEPRAVTFYRVDQHVIWGATARIVDQFLRTLGWLS